MVDALHALMTEEENNNTSFLNRRPIQYLGIGGAGNTALFGRFDGNDNLIAVGHAPPDYASAAELSMTSGPRQRKPSATSIDGIFQRFGRVHTMPPGIVTTL